MRGGLLRQVLTAAIVLAAVAGYAQDRGPITQHTLWTVEGGRSPVALLGSIHLLRRQNYPLERVIEDAFDRAQVVAFEIDLDTARASLDSPAPHAASAKARVGERRRPPRKLSTQISRETYQGVVHYLESAGLPGTLLDSLPPPAVASTLMQVELQQLGFDPDWGIDAYFYRRARKYGKTIVPLETVDEQLEAVGSLSERGSDELVRAALQDVATLRTTLRDLIRAWKGGEIDRLEHLVNGSFGDRPELQQRLLVERNARWLPEIEELVEGDQPALVIVGTGHLVGDDSLVAMLKAKGYIVRQQ
jgi:uncharacterized protein YbaP (TraB family)